MAKRVAKEDKKPMGRPRLYPPGTSQDNEGAPKLSIRFDPQLHAHVTAQPQGPRAYLEGLVRDDIEQGAAPVASTGPKDVPGQTLIPEVLASTGIVSETESASKKRTRKP